MASVKEICQIIEHLRPSKPVLIDGVHGIGKSESIRDYFEGKGYRVITLFLGQMSDAGDILGLPTRVEIDGETYTDFAPPKWWPKNKDENMVLFLDELNRAKPEIHQVIMDLVLNRKLGTRCLPETCRVIAAMNPIGEGVYQVEELDPALLDRFAKYEFRPTFEEWIDWALKVNVNKYVMSFLSKNQDHLDPPHASEYRPGRVYPSRRSWKTVSDILNDNENIDQILLTTILWGIVGERSTSSFIKFMRENKQIHAGTLLTNYSKVADQVKSLAIQDMIVLNREIQIWFDDNEKLILDGGKATNNVITNLEKYLFDVPAEVLAEFVERMSRQRTEKKMWPEQILKLSREIGAKMMQIMTGNG